MMIHFAGGGHAECHEVEIYGDTIMIDHVRYVKAWDIESISDEEGDEDAE